MRELETLITNWKAELSGKEGILPKNITELEDHLKMEILTLTKQGLNEEESFVIAKRRVGNAETLNQEFQKVNNKQIWMQRLKWMCLGVFLFQVWMTLDRIIPYLPAIMVYGYMNSLWASRIAFVVTDVVFILGIGLGLRMLWNGNYQKNTLMNKLINYIKKHPQTILYMSLFLVILHPYQIMKILVAHYFSVQQYSQFFLIGSWQGLLEVYSYTVFWIFFVGWLMKPQKSAENEVTEDF